MSERISPQTEAARLRCLIAAALDDWEAETETEADIQDVLVIAAHIARAELDVLREELQRRDELLYDAMAVIANANEGDWNGETPEWKAAAERWRDAWHEMCWRRAIGEEPNE